MAAVFASKPRASDFIPRYSGQIAGKTLLVTGVSAGGLGAFLVELLLTCPTPPKRIILAGRSPDKIQATKAKVDQVSGIESRAVLLDLCSFASVRKAAEEVNSWDEGLDVLVNNAGIMATPYAKTEDGNESQLQANHLGHFLFTGLIIDQLLKRKGRVVNISSDGYRFSPVRFHDYDFLDGKTYDPWTSYGQSKTFQLLFSRDLARRLGDRGLESYAVHPAVYGTNLAGNIASFDSLSHGHYYSGFDFATSEDESVASHVFAAFDPELRPSNGAYISLSRVVPPEEMYCWGRDDIDARKAWALSEKLVGQKFDF